MWPLVPGRGASGSFRLDTGGGTELLAIGPFPAGSYLRRLSVTVVLVGEAGVQTVAWGAAVTSSGDPTTGNYDAGTALIDRVDSLITGRPLVVAEAIQTISIPYEVFPGWRFQTGANWLTVLGVNFSANVEAGLFVAVEVWREFVESGGVAGRGGAP